MSKNSSYKYGCFHVGRSDMWGNYCPETGEYYLACNDTDPIVGGCVGVLASARKMPDGEWQDISVSGFEEYNNGYEVVRELLQLGHLTAKTLESFIEAGGEVWWDQPNYSNVGFFVEGEGGNRICWEVAAHYMDFDLCEELHNKLAPCSNQKFYDAYCKAHKAKFGEEFVIN